MAQRQAILPFRNSAQEASGLGGGTASKQLKGLQSASFLNAMRDKGRFRELIEGMQVTAVIDPDAGLFSAACRARMLAESGGTLA